MTLPDAPTHTPLPVLCSPRGHLCSLRGWSCLLLGSLVALALGMAPAGGQSVPTDVPASHWARRAVLSVVAKGVMDAPGGRFEGARKVNRREMAAILVRFAKAAQAGKWRQGQAAPLRTPARRAAVERGDRAITRYELASSIDRLGPLVAAGLPKTAKTYGQSEIIPPRASLKGVAKSDPAYAPLEYLTRNRMLWAPSRLLKPGPQAVTGADAADALSMVIVRVIDLATDEPQNKPDIGEPPARRPAPAQGPRAGTR